jgi:Branched-chain amino acid transport protein (AzlD)
MSSVLNDGFGGYLVLLAVALFAHEPWRWLGVALGRNISVESEIFLWVRAVATALVTGLVMKLVVFPAGTLAEVPLWMRAVALCAGIAVFLGSRRNLALGVASGAGLLAAMRWGMG